MPGELDWIMEAFYRLSASRQVGMNVGAIPFEAADAYARRYGITGPDDFDAFYTLLRAADSAYLEETHRKDGAAPKAPKTPKSDTVTRETHGR